MRKEKPNLKSQAMTFLGVLAIGAAVIGLTVWIMLSQQDVSSPKFDAGVKPVENYTPAVGKKWDDPK